jgi:hypothetical protein
MPKPIGLTDEQIRMIKSAAVPLHPHDRGAYLERVAALLANQTEIGDGLVARAVRAAQKEFLRARPIPMSERP